MFGLVKQKGSDPIAITVSGHQIGGESLSLIAGPCSVENEEQIHRIAREVSQCGATILRGGAFKPRTSPYDFQGLGLLGLEYLYSAARSNNMACVSEIMDEPQLEIAMDKIDILQIGSRNMHNFALLKAVGKTNKPVLLKRGFSATYKEFLLAAEYILNEGNPNVILCERGIRTFESYTRNTLDLNIIPIVRELSHLPIIVDPSHGTGKRNLIEPLSRAAIAAGASGVMIEVHYDPDNSYSDAEQAIDIQHFCRIAKQLRSIKEMDF